MAKSKTRLFNTCLFVIILSILQGVGVGVGVVLTVIAVAGGVVYGVVKIFVH